MKIKKFDVVELKNNQRAAIIKINNNEYFAEIVDVDGTTICKRTITKDEIKCIIYTK